MLYCANIPSCPEHTAVGVYSAHSMYRHSILGLHRLPWATQTACTGIATNNLSAELILVQCRRVRAQTGAICSCCSMLPPFLYLGALHFRWTSSPFPMDKVYVRDNREVAVWPSKPTMSTIIASLVECRMIASLIGTSRMLCGGVAECQSNRKAKPRSDTYRSQE